MAVRGTTPDYILTIEGYDLMDKTVYVTFAQGSNKLTKTGDDLEITTTTTVVDGTEVVTSAIALTLTQQETLFFKTGAVHIQVKWIDSDGKVLATNTAMADINLALLERVVAYVPDD